MPATKEVIWNGVSSATIPSLVIGKVTRKLLGKDRTVYRDIPGREGAWIFPEQRGMREIRMECFVQVDSFPIARRDAFDEVASWLGRVMGQSTLTISDEPNVYYEGVLGEPPDPDEWREAGTFEILFTVQPYALGLAVTTHTVTGDDNFSHTWDPDIEIPTDPVIEVTPTDGTLLGFELAINGNTLIWAGTLADDTTLTIDGVNVVVLTGSVGDVSLTGAYNPANLNMEGVFGTFPTLIPGNNIMTFVKTGGTATAVTIVIKYRKRYHR